MSAMQTVNADRVSERVRTRPVSLSGQNRQRTLNVSVPIQQGPEDLVYTWHSYRYR